MKRNSEFLLREVAGKQVVVPLGKAAASFPGMLTLNSSGVFLWEALAQEQTQQSLVAAVCEKYDADPETAQKDICAFLDKLRAVGALSE